jgi:PBP1b-binding outer membrane lipoprotein LpoB
VIDHVVETAKKSETRKHSPQVHKDHVADVTAGMPHVTVETAHVEELVKRAETTPDAALSDPAAYHEAVLNGEKTVNIPIADVTSLADVVTPEDVKRMSVGKTPSVEAAEKAAEAEKAQEAAKKGAVELRPAVNVGEAVAKDKVVSDLGAGTATDDGIAVTAAAKEELLSGNFVSVTTTKGLPLRLVHLESDLGNGQFEVKAFNESGDEVGSLLYSRGDLENPNVMVTPENRRKGIATVLYNAAESRGGTIPGLGTGEGAGELRTKDGQAFRESRGTTKEQNSSVGRSVLRVGEPGQRHTDIVKGTPEETRGFTLDGKTMLSREEAAAWLKENHPDLHAKLPEDQKTSLHSEGLWGAQGIDVPGAERVAIKNAAVESEREGTGQLPADKISRTMKAIHEEGKRLVDSGEYDPRLGARRIVENPTGIVSAEQQAALLYDKARLKNETNTVMTQLERAIEADDMEAVEQLRQRQRQLETDYATNQQATTYAGTSASAALRIRVSEMKEDYSLAHVMQRVRLAVGKVDPATGKIEVPPEVRAEVEKLVKDLDAALADTEGAVEKAAQAEAQKFVTEAVKAEVKKTKRAAKGEGVEAKRKVLDTEFVALQKALDKVLNPNKLNIGVDPEVIPILVKMAKNRIAVGLNTVNGIVNSIHAAVGDKLDVTKREIRDAISGYGKEPKPTKNVLTARLNEVKAQAKLISALEDIKKGERPKKGGSTHTVSEKVKELRAKVDQAMRDAGFKHSITPEEHQAAALKAVKARLTNKIAELKKQILTGEQAAKKAGVKYDAEANALKATVAKLQALYDDTEAGNKAKTEHRVKAAVTSLRRINAELARKIKDRDVAAKEAGAPLPETPELKAERALHDDLKKQYKTLVDSLKVPKDVEEAKRAAYSAHLDKVIADLERKLDTGDFSKKPVNKLKLDPATAAKKEKADRLRAKIEGKIKEQYKNNRSLPEKVKDTVVEIARFTLLTGVGTLEKLTMAAASRFGISPTEAVMGSLLEIIPPLKEIGKGAYREGGGFRLSAEAARMRSIWEHGQTDDAVKIWKDGLSKLNVQYGDHKIASQLTVLASIGRLHKILKNPAHVGEFAASVDYITAGYERVGFDVSDPLVQALIHAQAHLEADRAILMNPNMLSNLPKIVMRTAHDQGGFYAKAAVALSQVEFPIIKMATNYANEVLSYTAGGLRAVPGLSKAAIKGIDKLTPLERDYILRNLKKNSVATILATAVFSGVIGVKFGGYLSKDDKRVPGDLEPGEWSINGHKMPKALSHIPLFEAMQIFQTIKDVSEAMRIRGEGVISRNAEGVAQGLYSIAEHVPFIGTGTKDMEALGTAEGRSKYFAALVTSRVIPPDVGNIAKYLDDNTPRQPTGLLETAESKIPGLRKNVPLNEKAIKREIVGKLRNDEDLTPYQQDMWDSFSPEHQEALEKEAEETPLQVAFTSIQDPHLIKSVKAWGILTDDERDQVRDIYDARVMRYFDTHDLTDEQLTDLNARLDAAEERR